MTALWDKIIVLLEQILQIYKALLQLSRKKKDILIAANSQELEHLTKQEEMLIIQAGKLEKERLAIIKELAAALGVPAEQLVLSKLSEHADSQTAAKLMDVNDSFAEITGELSKNNKINSRLIQQALDYANFSINILSQNRAEPTYAPQGQNAGKASRTIFDTKA